MGFILAITASILFAFRDSFNKYLARDLSPLVVYWAALFFTIPLFGIAVLVQGFPAITQPFWLMVALGVPLYVGSSVLLIKAVKISPLSVTLPFLGFSPVFMLLTSWLILGQLPNAWGIIGIVLVTTGAYFIHFQRHDRGWLAPFRAIRRERGSWYAIIVALIWSVTANFDKIAIDHSSPVAYLLIYDVASFVLLSVVIVARKQFREIGMAVRRWPLFGLAGAVMAGATLLHMLAIQFILVPYMITIKRAGSILGGVVIGATYFRESGFRHRIAAATIMAIGVAMILLLSQS